MLILTGTRAARLLRVVERRNLRYHQLRLGALEEAAEDLRRLAPGPGGGR